MWGVHHGLLLLLLGAHLLLLDGAACKDDYPLPLVLVLAMLEG
jgi:hypothetical protein